MCEQMDVETHKIVRFSILILPELISVLTYLFYFYPHLKTCLLILERGERKEREGENHN